MATKTDETETVEQPTSGVDLGEFTLVAAPKPKPEKKSAISQGEIPPALAALMEAHAPASVKDGHVITLTAESQPKADLILAYAKAWGARQDPALYVKKLPKNRDGSDLHIIRMVVEVDSEANKAGRKAGQ